MTGSSTQTCRGRATALGSAAIALSSLAVLTTLADASPPLQWMAMAFTIGGALGLIVASRSAAGQHAWRHLAALAAAVVWASYSVLTRRFGATSTHAVGAFCAVTAMLATRSSFGRSAVVACLLIVGGAVLAAGLGSKSED